MISNIVLLSSVKDIMSFEDRREGRLILNRLIRYEITELVSAIRNQRAGLLDSFHESIDLLSTNICPK